jgi:hypothetical protein
MDTIVAPRLMMRTSTPWLFVNVKSSTAVPSGIVPKG